MTEYLIRRLLLTVPTFLGITVLVFTVTRFVPGGPIERMIASAQQRSSEGSRSSGNSMGSQVLSDEQLQQLKEYYGFDKPVFASYVLWLGKLACFDLGTSTRYNEPVWESIKSRIPVSLFFGFVTMVLTYALCIPLGILKAIKHKTAIDHLTSVLIFVGYAVPGYVIGIGLLVFLAAKWDWLPLGGFVGDDFASLTAWGKLIDLLKHSILPLGAYMVSSLAVMSFLMKNTLLDQLSADYMRTAVAKGNKFNRAVFTHALRNSLIPLATQLGGNLAGLIAGSFLIEKIFNINGFGLLGFESVVERDYPVVMGVLVISAVLQLLGNIISDVSVAIVDPRVKYE